MRAMLLLGMMVWPLAAQEGGVEELPGVDQVISERVRSLPEPAPAPMADAIVMAVTAVDEETQAHVRSGMAHLQGGWDFEAYRHFCAALQRDPNCVMAHWGVAMALIDPEPDLRDESQAALERLLELVQREEGTELERSYGYGLTVFLKQGPAAAADAYRKVSNRFPNDPQLKVLQAVFGRTGYAEDGSANPEQERSEEMLRALMERQPENPLLLNAYLSVRAESPEPEKDLELARKLVRLSPEYPPFQHLLGHYEWRCGHPGTAIGSFRKAADGYRAWMKQSKLQVIDSPGLIKAELYRAAALATKGDYDNALETAKALAQIEVPAARAQSDGGKMLLWEGRTLPARLLMKRGLKGDAAKAIELLPPRDAVKVYGDHSTCPVAYQGVAFVLNSRNELEKGGLLEAKKASVPVTMHGKVVEQARTKAGLCGELTYWSRFHRGFAVMEAELLGDLAMEDSKASKGGAWNWYRAAIDRQGVASTMLPPYVLTPMAVKMAKFHLAEKKAEKAVAILTGGTTEDDVVVLDDGEEVKLPATLRRVVDHDGLLVLAEAYEALGHREEAEQAREEATRLREE